MGPKRTGRTVGTSRVFVPRRCPFCYDGAGNPGQGHAMTTTLREQFEARERARYWRPGAGVLRPRRKGAPCPKTSTPYRTAFQRDRDRIVHTKAFRRLKRKTQVFLSPHGDHYRTRLTHTLEVAQNRAHRRARAVFSTRTSSKRSRAGPRPRPHAFRPRGRGGAQRMLSAARLYACRTKPCASSNTSKPGAAAARGST